MFRNVIKDTDLKFGYPSELHDLIWLYSSLMDVDRKMEYVNLVIVRAAFISFHFGLFGLRLNRHFLRELPVNIC